jgi:hypothetical protein
MKSENSMRNILRVILLRLKAMFSFYHCQDAAPISAPARNSRFAGFLPDSEVIHKVKIAESPVKRAFRGV